MSVNRAKTEGASRCVYSREDSCRYRILATPAMFQERVEMANGLGVDDFVILALRLKGQQSFLEAIDPRVPALRNEPVSIAHEQENSTLE
jgi:hypothetical protein